MNKRINVTFLILLTILSLSNLSFEKNTSLDKNIFMNDSGYVSIKNGEKFLLELKKSDTVDFEYKKRNENDTIGKYYKKENSQNYCLFLNLENTKLEPTQFILEVDSIGNILKSERYVNGYYLCCWKNEQDVFGKINDYFFIKSCGSGSAFCSTEIYLFKEITPQDDLNTILKEMFNGMCEPDKNGLLPCVLESKIEVKSQSIVFHYVYKKGISRNGKKYKKLEKFDVEYSSKNNTWIANDSTKLNTIEH